MTYAPQPPYGPPPEPKKKSKLPLFLGVGGATLAVVLGLVLVAALGGSRKGGNAGPPNAAVGGASPSGQAGAALNDLPVEKLREAMPQQPDFPPGWDVKTNTAPVKAEGIGQMLKDASVDPPECQKVIEDELGTRSGADAGEWITVISAIDREAAASGMPSALSFTALRKLNTKPDFGSFGQSLATCSHLTVSFQGIPDPVDIDFSPFDTSGITGAQSIGATGTISGAGMTTVTTSISALTRGVVVSASEQGATDQKATLVKLVQQTVNKLNAL